MQGYIKVICSKFCKQRSYMCVSWSLPMLKGLVHVLSFFFVGVQSPGCNPCLLINITSLQTIRLNTIISVNGSAQRGNYFKKNLKLITKKGGPEQQNVTTQESGIEQLRNRPIVRRIRYFCNFCFLLCHFMVCGFVKFATFRIFVILPSAHFGLAENIRSLRILLYLRRI